ncbi:protocadherin Fat 1-like isoform X2 [Clavelina lepadiformis]|uniref:protocadherin Fat 1-like isoform X2 n=1 Tax=Clavelina lepadiformis TaxID=159417 RepID=UPI0040413A20
MDGLIRSLKAMIKALFVTTLIFSCCNAPLSEGSRHGDTFAFTKPTYKATVREKTARGVVESLDMMGMWLTSETKYAVYSVISGGQGIRASKKIVGNFVFLDLNTRFLNTNREVLIKAITADMKKEVFCTVFIQVLDINDFQPLFPERPYAVTIGEDTEIGTTIAHVQAIDSDRNSENTRFYYSFSDFTNIFAINPTTGAVTLTSLVSHETQSVHSLKIRATDRKAALSRSAQPKETTLTVTVRTANKHAPKINVHYTDFYTFSNVRDRSNADRLTYAILEINDPDSGRYGRTAMPRITKSDAGDAFQIQPSGNGNEYLLQFRQEPPSVNTVLNVTVEVSDRGYPPKISSAVIHVRLYDRQAFIPVFEENPFRFQVSEFSPPFTQVGFAQGRVKDTSKPHNVRYQIEAGNEEGVFAINENNSLITTTARLNRNAQSEYRLTLAVTNTNLVGGDATSRTTVVVSIEDANDKDPVFTENSYEARISEDVPKGTAVINLLADDNDFGKNGSVLYSLVDAAEMPFRIDPFNGTIFTTQLLDFDTMSKSIFNIRVRASDRGTPFSRRSESYVTVQVTNTNDNPPTFDKADCTVSVPVTAKNGITVLALDPVEIDRNDVVHCSILSGSRGMFTVDPATCTVRITRAFRSARVGTKVIMKIVASDGEFTSTPVAVNITVTPSTSAEHCRNTGALARLQQSLNSRILHSTQQKIEVNFNTTSELPNNFAPVVKRRDTFTHIEVAENVEVGTIVASVDASDADSGFNGMLWYTIISGNNEGCFTVKTQTGEILIARPLDRERTSEHSLRVRVSDLAAVAKETVVMLGFVVTDVNDNAPVFDSEVYSFELQENVPVGYSIERNIHAVDIDEGQNAQIRYSIPTSTADSKFAIHPVTGQLKVTGSLDRETIEQYRFNIIATDGSPNQPLSSSTTVAIRLADVNDNPPRFYRPRYRVRIAEDLPVGTVIFWLQAHDPDAGDNGIVRYSLTDGLTNRYDRKTMFSVDDRTGAIRLAAALDYRVQNRYNITARARDSKHLVTTCFVEVEILEVNRNLYPPYFLQRNLKIAVSEDAAIGTPIRTVSAIDDDEGGREKNVGYSIVDGTGLGVFTINENTGTITTLRTLDRETEQFYWLTIVGKDRAPYPLSDHMFVLVEVTDVNDNAPYTDKPVYYASVEENSPIGSPVITIIATDRDTGTGSNLTYRIINNRSYFTIDPKTGIVRTNTRKLDRETVSPSNLTFEVRISDGGDFPLSTTIKVFVNITDVNDNSPRFLSDSFVQDEIKLPAKNRTRVSFPIARVVALDEDSGPNADIDYKLVNSNGRFSIHPKNGIISTDQAFHDDRSVIKVAAYDLGKPQGKSKIKRVEIEWGPHVPRTANAPRFTSDDLQVINMYYEHVSVEYVRDETQVKNKRYIRTVEATDVDSDRLWFYIIQGNDDGMFHINSDGSLFITGHPDAERKDFYNLTIQVTDGFNSDFADVPVQIGDINDHRPVFSHEVYHASISENSPANSPILRVSATDGDISARNKDLIYSIRGSIDPLSRDKFRITSRGQIYTTVMLDREAQREHTLTIGVDDQGAPGSLQAYCRVVITVEDTNEHPPRFTASSYSALVMTGAADAQVGADDSVGKVALRVRATDQDQGENARVIYSISAGNIEGLWRINPSTGDIYPTRRLAPRDGTPVSRSSFTVQASDGAVQPLANHAKVTIDIRAYDDTPPRFQTNHLTIALPEDTPKDSFVAMLTATAPSGVTYNVTSVDDDDDSFIINPHSGVVSLQGKLDREEVTSYELLVTAINSEGKSSTAHIEVNVMDVNDNRPVFESLFYVGKIYESHVSSASTFITKEDGKPLVVRASDRDIGDNARIAYRLVKPSEAISERFTVDEATGAIRALPGTGLFDYEMVKEYSFEIQAFDLGSPRLYSASNAHVNIRVMDANDTVVTFTKTNYHLSVMLPTCEGVIVSQETRAQPETGSSQSKRRLTYSLGSDNPAFVIDPLTGVISVADAGALEADEVALSLRVTDGKKTAAAVAVISVTEMPRHKKFTFSKTVYETQARENTTQTKDLVVVSIRGMELDDNVRFSILNPTPYFAIDSTSGVISTTGVPIDREEKAQYELLVEAVHIDFQASSQRRDRTIARITIIDVNDNPPQFVGEPYYATVQVDALRRSLVKQVRTFDADEGRNRIVRYRLEEAYQHLFDVDERDGVVVLNQTPGEVTDGNNAQYNVTVFADSIGPPLLTSQTILRVSVINRATPIFTEPVYGGFEIPENAKAHTVVTTDIQASSPEGSNVFYTIEYGDTFHQFDIDFVGGTLTSLGNLDYETQSHYRLQIRARDSKSRAFADVFVNIDVVDVNDNIPVFSQTSYVARMRETARVGSTVLQITASDADSGANGQIRYTILPNEDSSDATFFLLDPDSGVVWTARGLDHESTPKLSFVARATDSGMPMLYTDVTVTLYVDDVNDNPPEFNKETYEFYVNVNAKPGQFIGKISAWDADSEDRDKLVYTLHRSTTSSLLEINPTTGVVALADVAKMTPELIAIHANVSVTDGVFTSSAGFIVHVTSHDTSPSVVTFDQTEYNITLVENTGLGRKLGTVTATGNGALLYAIEPDAGSDMFRIDANTGNVFNEAAIDRESFTANSNGDVIISFYVSATDHRGSIARSRVNVYVLDVNDNYPIFTQDSYVAVVVVSSARADDHVIKLAASDLDAGKNGSIRYSWDEDDSNAKRFFRLNSFSGEILIHETPRFMGNLRTLSFFIRASDRGTPDSKGSVVSVSVYLASDSDPVPRFEMKEWIASIPENNYVGSEVIRVRASVRSSTIKYFLAPLYITDEEQEKVSSGNSTLRKHPFNIDPLTGVITTSRVLDREEQAVYVIDVLAVVETTPDLVASAKVTVNLTDVNDNSPQFVSSEYHCSVVENTPATNDLLFVEANDPDLGVFGQVTYSLVQPDDESTLPFAIDTETGMLRSLIPLDRENTDRYDLTVRASDGGRGQKQRDSICHVIVHVIDVNDEPPIFSHSEYRASILESASIGQLTSKFIHASDNDSQGGSRMQLYILQGDPDGLFEISSELVPSDDHSVTAALRVMKEGLNREVQSVYHLTLLATDGLHTSTTRVVLSVRDVNDNKPVCEQLSYRASVREDAEEHTLVLLVTSHDNDAGNYGTVVYSLDGEGSNMFDLDSRTGELFTAALLDRETTARYWLSATATDGGGLTCASKILIDVNDVNDNAPHFVESSLRTSARENAPVDSLIHRVVACDQDMGENGTFSYSLTDDINGQFFIEPDTGVILLMKPLDRETVPFYELEIVATDHGSEKSLSSRAGLRLQVLDVNDNPPVFRDTQYKATVREDVRPGHSVVTVEAKSLDTGANAKLRYSITYGNEHGKFLINENTGEVKLSTTVDFESDQSYVLTISASDRSEHPLSSDCTLHVQVLDVNDNRPEFFPVGELSVPEDAEVGRIISTIPATDRDSGLAGNVTFSLSRDAELPFSINPETGKFIVVSPGLDYERQRSYRVVVVATDGGSPALSSEVTITVNVDDINDNRPRFLVASSTGGDFDKISCSLDGANCTVYVHESSSDPVVHGVVSLNATDEDGKGNAGPFKFRILSGNDAGLFYLDKNNFIKSRRTLRLNDITIDGRRQNSQELVHQLIIEATDSGHPYYLTSQPPLQLNIIVIKESQYAPEMKTHKIEIFLRGMELERGLISQSLQATDRDTFDEDRLRFSLASPEDVENFVIDPVTGSITAETPLSEGDYDVLVRVSDGSRATTSTIPIIVRRVTQQALENSVSISFRGIHDAENYLSRYNALFVDKLREMLPNGFDHNRDLLTISVQARDDLVDVLFAVRKPPDAKAPRSFYLSKSLRKILENNRPLIEEKLRVRVADIQGVLCAEDECSHGSCRQIPTLDPLPETLNPVTTISRSLVTSTFKREKRCVCSPGHVGPACVTICSSGPCPRDQTCATDETEVEGYRCENPSRPKSTMTFSGRSFIKYRLSDASRHSPFRLTFRVRSFQSAATIFYARGPSHSAKLEIFGGFLRYTFDCGSGPQSMVRYVQDVDDGHWHDVDIKPLEDRSNCAFKLTVGTYIASVEATGGAKRLDLTSITFGGMPDDGRSKRSRSGVATRSRRNVSHGFRGCLQRAELNNVPLPSPSSAPSSGSGNIVEEHSGVTANCRNSLINMEACSGTPCLNGGRCMPLSDGSHACECPLEYDGERCEIPDPCGPLPCKNKGVCLGHGNEFRCDCEDSGFSGDHCEIPSACLAVNQCANGGTCVVQSESATSCVCPPEWKGLYCQIDVNECETSTGKERCGGSEECHNYEGGFSCNCSSGVDCHGLKNPSVNEGVVQPYIIIIAVVVLLFIIVGLVCFVCYKKRSKKGDGRYTRGSRRSHDFQPTNNYNQRSNRPQIPERPSDYQRSSRDSFNMIPLQDDQERNRRMCLVFPQIPPTSPVSGSDNDSIKKPPPSWQEYDPAKFNESASSSVHHFPANRKVSEHSFSDQQIVDFRRHGLRGRPYTAYDWDITDWKPGGSGVVSPAIASVAYDRQSRAGHSDVPSSPESRHSHVSTSTNRSRRSHRSDALPGYYSNGRRRREKQLLRMVEVKDFRETPIPENERWGPESPEVYRINNQNIPGLGSEHGRDSRGSSLRSSSSRFKPYRNDSFPRLPHDPVPPSPVANSVDENYSQGYADNEYEETIDDAKGVSPSAYVTSDDREISTSSGRPSGSESDSAPRSSGSEKLPPPPTDYELKALQEREDEDETLVNATLLPATNHSYSSLLASPFNVDMPTPAAARSSRFHPDEYLLNHYQQASDISEATTSAPGSNFSLDHPFIDPRYGKKPYEVPNKLSPDIPLPPERHDSVRLELSCLSEDEEEEESACEKQRRHHQSKRRHHGHGRPPTDSKSRSKREKKLGEKRGTNWLPADTKSSQEMKPLYCGDHQEDQYIMDDNISYNRINTNV